jgi:hypothetical protein
MLILLVLLFLFLYYFEHLYSALSFVRTAYQHDSLFEVLYFESRIGRFLRKLATLFGIVLLKPTSPFVIHALLNNLDDDFRARVFGPGLRSLLSPSQSVTAKEAERLILDAARRLNEQSDENQPKSIYKGTTEIVIEDSASILPIPSLLLATMSNFRNFLRRRPNIHALNPSDQISEDLRHRNLFQIPFELQRILIKRQYKHYI